MEDIEKVKKTSHKNDSKLKTHPLQKTTRASLTEEEGVT